MTDFRQVAVAALNTIPKADLNPYDDHVPAVYSVMVQKGLTDALMASVALDVLHSTCPIKCLDDFEFVVFESDSGQILFEDETQERYANTGLGRDLQRISDSLPSFYSVNVNAIGDDADVSELGSVQLAANNQKEAITKAHSLLWDARLDSASCSPDYEIEEREACELRPDEAGSRVFKP